MFYIDRFKDRFALGAGIYIGSWGVHIYIDIWQWRFAFESKRDKTTPKQRGRQTGI